MAPLSSTQTEQLIDECKRLLRESQQITAVLADLPESVGARRGVLNELHRVVSTPAPVKQP